MEEELQTQQPSCVCKKPIAVHIIAFLVFIALIALVIYGYIQLDRAQDKLTIAEQVIGAQTEEITEPAADTKSFQIKGYTFDYPAEWVFSEVTVNETELFTHHIASFSDAKGNVLGMITCPPPEVGFEAWNFEADTHMIATEDSVYKFLFSYGEPVPETSDLGWKYLIAMGTVDNSNMFHPTGVHECFLSTTAETFGEDDYSLFESIYKSIQVK